MLLQGVDTVPQYMLKTGTPEVLEQFLESRYECLADMLSIPFITVLEKVYPDGSAEYLRGRRISIDQSLNPVLGYKLDYFRG